MSRSSIQAVSSWALLEIVLQIAEKCDPAMIEFLPKSEPKKETTHKICFLIFALSVTCTDLRGFWESRMMTPVSDVVADLD